MKKGFTLVELLAVLVILAIAVAVAATSYAKISKEQKTKQCNNLKKQIENVAIEYVVDNNGIYNDGNQDQKRWVSLGLLINNGYIDSENLENPVDGKKCDFNCPNNGLKCSSGWNCSQEEGIYGSADYYVVVEYDNGKYMSSFGGITCEY